MRILHFSDIHIGLGLRRVPWTDWAGKRLAGGANLLRGRGRQFADAARKTRALVEFHDEIEADMALCTGDLTALGTHAEFAAARDLLAGIVESPGFVVTPGNHDLYTPSAVRERRFERAFEAGLRSDAPDLATDGPWPLVRLPADDVAVVAVNSARPTRSPWKSNGRVPAAQIEGLRTALADDRVGGRFVFLMTHYAPCLADGSPDTSSHGLRNLDQLLDAVRPIRRGAYLCGHVHTTFRREIDDFGGEVFCAGSATFEGLEGVWVFDRDGPGWRARRASWTGDAFELAAEGAAVAGGPQ